MIYTLVPLADYCSRNHFMFLDITFDETVETTSSGFSLTQNPDRIFVWSTLAVLYSLCPETSKDAVRNFGKMIGSNIGIRHEYPEHVSALEAYKWAIAILDKNVTVDDVRVLNADEMSHLSFITDIDNTKTLYETIMRIIWE